MAILLDFQCVQWNSIGQFQRVQLEFQGCFQDVPRSKYPFMPETQDMGPWKPDRTAPEIRPIPRRPCWF
jgi:hypothetical protein